MNELHISGMSSMLVDCRWWWSCDVLQTAGRGSVGSCSSRQSTESWWSLQS